MASSSDCQCELGNNYGFTHNTLQCFGSRHWVRIRILHFRLNTYPDRGFWWPKIGKNTTENLDFYFLIKNYSLLISRTPQRTSKLQETPSTLKRKHPALQIIRFSFFVGHFCPSGSRSGSTTLMFYVMVTGTSFKIPILSVCNVWSIYIGTEQNIPVWSFCKKVYRCTDKFLNTVFARLPEIASHLLMKE